MNERGRTRHGGLGPNGAGGPPRASERRIAEASEGADRRLALTTSGVARRLGVSVGTVRRWADHGHLTSYRTPGGQRRFSAEDVDSFVSSLERGRGTG